MYTFRDEHLLKFLKSWKATQPLDFALHQFFKEHHSLGSKDRREIREKVIRMIRHLRLIDYPSTTPLAWEERLKRVDDPREKDVPPAVAVSFPDFIYDELVKTWGEEEAFSIAQASNTQAPITIRANIAKISRDDLLKKLSEQFEVIPTTQSPWGITFLEPVRFDTVPEFREGLFEVQDEGSQLIAEKVKVKPGDLFLDYCSGSGGKSLAVAPFLEGKGSLFLTDIREEALQEAKKRLRKAGVQNVQFLMKEHQTLKKMKHKIDWVLVDAPCSGTGTLRRSPDMKWRLNEVELKNLVATQRKIFDEALRFVKPGGKISYATCSLLALENEEQMDFFLKAYPIKLYDEPLKTYPKVNSMDGFFAVTFTTNP